MYLSGNKLVDIAPVFNLAPTSCSAVLKRHNIQTRICTDYLQSKFNTHFFEIIDSESKAYWLGFIFADGCLSKSKFRNSIIISLANKDYTHLLKFQKDIASSNLVSNSNKLDKRTNNIYYTSRIQLGSKKLTRDLKKYNLVPQKSFIAYPNMDLIPSHLHHHFWRGVFDGDGSLHQRKSRYDKNKKINSWQLYLCGSYGMLLLFYNFIGISDTYFYNKTNIWYLSFSNLKSCSIILDKLYKDSTIYLDRKYELYLRFKDLNP